MSCLVFSHQSFEENDDGIENRSEIRDIFEKENHKASFNKVAASFCGHHHTDFVSEINGIHDIQINSMSYQWLGDKYQTVQYCTKIDEYIP